MITFSVSDVSTVCDLLPAQSMEAALSRRIDGPIEAGKANADNLVDDEYWRGRGIHSLIATVHMAFDQHHPLVLSPDDIWLSIAQGFGIHVNQQAELLRSRIVGSLKGKQLIEVRRDHFVKGSPDNDWAGCFAEFSDGIAAQVGRK